MEPEKCLLQKDSEEGSQKEKSHTCLSTAPGSVQEEGSARSVPAASGAPAAVAASFLMSEAAERRTGRDCCKAGGTDCVKGLGTETCGVSYSQRDGRGKD